MEATVQFNAAPLGTPLLDAVALVVGAGGLGAGLALGLAQAGADVAVADVDLDRAERAASAARTAGRDASACSVDLADPSSVESGVAAAVVRHGRVDVLVNAAGVTHLAPAEAFPDEQWERVLAVNLTGVFLTCRAVAPHMLERGSGAIVNVSSIAGSAGLANTVAYCASKGGVDQLTRALAVEWAPRGIRVNAVAPSWFATDMGALLDTVPELRADRLGRVPLGRVGEVSELVGAVVFLASPAASMVTGAVLPVDGGFLAR